MGLYGTQSVPAGSRGDRSHWDDLFPDEQRDGAMGRIPRDSADLRLLSSGSNRALCGFGGYPLGDELGHLLRKIRNLHSLVPDLPGGDPAAYPSAGQRAHTGGGLNRKVRGWGANLLLVVASILITLGGLEIALRLCLPQKLYRYPRGLFREDSDLVFTLTPGYHARLRNPEYTTDIRIN